MLQINNFPYFDIPPKKEFKGLIVTNPPYGERLGEIEDLIPLYQVLGRQLKSGFIDWQLALFTSNFELSKTIGVRAKKYYAFGITYSANVTLRF